MQKERERKIAQKTKKVGKTERKSAGETQQRPGWKKSKRGQKMKRMRILVDALQ